MRYILPHKRWLENNSCKNFKYKSYSNGDVRKIIVWKVPKSEAFPDGIKYSFVLIHNNKRILGYDNERAKSHHKHYKGKEIPIKFKNLGTLYEQFVKEAKQLREKLLGGKKNEN